jgi:hypothetical protein
MNAAIVVVMAVAVKIHKPFLVLVIYLVMFYFR